SALGTDGVRKRSRPRRPRRRDQPVRVFTRLPGAAPRPVRNHRGGLPAAGAGDAPAAAERRRPPRRAPGGLTVTGHAALLLALGASDRAGGAGPAHVPG